MDRRRRFSDYWADTVRDFRFTLRTLRRDAGFTVLQFSFSRSPLARILQCSP